MRKERVMLCVFDIETIPSVSLCKDHFQLEEDDALKICERSFEKQKKKAGASFCLFICMKLSLLQRS